MYWNNRPCPNSCTGVDNEDIISWVEDRIDAGANVVEFGPGVGRMFPAYKRASSVVGIEISRIYVSRLFDAAKIYPFKFSVILSNSVFPPEFLNGFDVCVASMVLLHQKPENVREIMLRLAKMAREVLVVTWRSERDNLNISPHCFNHDYEKICSQNELSVWDWELHEESLRFKYAIL